MLDNARMGHADEPDRETNGCDDAAADHRMTVLCGQGAGGKGGGGEGLYRQTADA